MKRVLLLSTMLLTVAATSAAAQGAPASGQIEGVVWYVASYTKFKPGMAEEARKIVMRRVGSHRYEPTV
jgi:hypothetical protein